MFGKHWIARKDLLNYIDNVNHSPMEEVLKRVNENRDEILNPSCMDQYG